MTGLLGSGDLGRRLAPIQEDPVLVAGSSRWRGWGCLVGLPALAGCAGADVVASSSEVLPAIAPSPAVEIVGEIPRATLLRAMAGVEGLSDRVCRVTVATETGVVHVTTPCTPPAEALVDVAVAVRVDGGGDVPGLVEVFRADGGFLRDGFETRLLVAARRADLPLGLGADVRVELGAGPDQRVASEVISRADGCSFAFTHARLGLSDRDSVTWAAAGDAMVLSVGGVELEWRVHAVAIASRLEGGCDAERVVGFTLSVPWAAWPRSQPSPGAP